MESSGGEAGWSSIFRPLQLKAAALLRLNVQPSYFGADLFGRRFSMAAMKIRCCSFELLLSSYPFPLPGCFSRSFISDTLLHHQEQSLVSDRKAGGLHRGWSKDRGGVPPVPWGFISHPDIMIFFFLGEQMDFLLPEKRFKLQAETTECHCRLLSGHL